MIITRERSSEARRRAFLRREAAAPPPKEAERYQGGAKAPLVPTKSQANGAQPRAWVPLLSKRTEPQPPRAAAANEGNSQPQRETAGTSTTQQREPYSTNGSEAESTDNRRADDREPQKRRVHSDVAPLYFKAGSTLRQLTPATKKESFISKRAPYPKRAIRYINGVLADAELSAATAYFVKHVLHSQLVQRRGDALDDGGFVPIPADVRTLQTEDQMYRLGFSADEMPEGAESLPESRVMERGAYGFRHDERTADADLEAAREAGVLIVREHKITAGKCAGYKVPHQIEETFIEECRKHMDRYPKSTTRYNLFDITQTIRIARTPKKNLVSDKNNNPYPQIILDGMDAVEERPFNWNAMERELEKLHSRKEQMERFVFAETPEVAALLMEEGIMGKKKDTGSGNMNSVREAVRRHYGWASKQMGAVRALEKARGRWLTAMLSFEAIKGQKPTPAESGALWSYKAAYAPSTTGRITERLGGAQNFPRELKAASIEGVEDVRNYDGESMHDTMLQIDFATLGVDALNAEGEDYFARFQSYEGDVKQAAADYVGCTRETFKCIHHALKMQGAAQGPIPKNGKDGKAGWIVPDIFAYLQDDEKVSGAKEALKRFRTLTEPLREALREWRKKIEARAWGEASPNQHGEYWKNAVGMTFPLHEWLDPEAKGEKLTSKGRRKLAAHVLQGMEAYFIHTLAAILKETEGVKVIANEHDGLITIGEIPQTAIDEAKQRTGYDGLKFKEKPIA